MLDHYQMFIEAFQANLDNYKKLFIKFLVIKVRFFGATLLRNSFNLKVSNNV